MAMFSVPQRRFLSVFSNGIRVLTSPLPEEKVSQSYKTTAQWNAKEIPLFSNGSNFEIPDTPTRPPLPKIVPVLSVPKPKSVDLSSAQYILLTIAHIELNAVECYWDTCLRFIKENKKHENEFVPSEFFNDILKVISDECRHFTLLNKRLNELGIDYQNDILPAHNQQWDHSQLTTGDMLARLAIVPMVQEARGLDAGPRFVKKLISDGDECSAQVVQLIVDEEVEHVEFGLKWFRFLCEKSGDCPVKSFHELVRRYVPKGLVPPFNVEQRLKAGLTEEFYKPVSKEFIGNSCT